MVVELEERSAEARRSGNGDKESGWDDRIEVEQAETLMRANAAVRTSRGR